MGWLAGILGRSTRRPAAPRQLQVRARYDAAATTDAALELDLALDRFHGPRPAHAAVRAVRVCDRGSAHHRPVPRVRRADRSEFA